ncbi:MAG: integrase [Alphaproteobacteria bacterium]|nr:MAG: integrase [Alphaproteobacteria bacterium]
MSEQVVESEDEARGAKSSARWGNRPLTARQVEAAQPRAERYEISDGGTALRLVVFPSGAKSWALRYRIGRRPRKMTLGRFPALGLKDARELAGDALKRVAKGGDPGAEKIAERRRVRDTVKALADQWVEAKQRPNNSERYVAEVERILKQYVTPQIGSRDIAEITRRDVFDVLDKSAKKGRLVPNQVLAVLRPFFSWCVERGAIDASPAMDISAPAAAQPRDRVLTEVELRALLVAINEIGEPWRDFLEMLALTAQRRNEVAAMPWGEVDLSDATWTIQGDRAKNGIAHAVALAPRAVEILTARRKKAPKNAKYVFPAQRGGHAHLSGFGHMKYTLDALMLAELRKDADEPERIVLPNWRLHDLRRTAATGMAALGHPIHVVERVLNHIAGSTTGGLIAVYQRHDYAAERRAALEAWASYLHGLRA